jgi:hypothetical protein
MGNAALRPFGAPRHSNLGSHLVLYNGIKTVTCRKYSSLKKRNTIYILQIHFSDF